MTKEAQMVKPPDVPLLPVLHWMVSPAASSTWVGLEASVKAPLYDTPPIVKESSLECVASSVAVTSNGTFTVIVHRSLTE